MPSSVQRPSSDRPSALACRDRRFLRRRESWHSALNTSSETSSLMKRTLPSAMMTVAPRLPFGAGDGERPHAVFFGHADDRRPAAGNPRPRLRRRHLNHVDRVRRAVGHVLHVGAAIVADHADLLGDRRVVHRVVGRIGADAGHADDVRRALVAQAQAGHDGPPRWPATKLGLRNSGTRIAPCLRFSSSRHDFFLSMRLNRSSCPMCGSRLASQLMRWCGGKCPARAGRRAIRSGG